MTIVVHEHGEFSAESAGNALWVGSDQLASELGWELKPEGFCQGDTCVPVPAGRENEFVKDDAVDLSALWRHMGKPVVSSEDGDIWSLGESASAYNEALATLEAPDFELPDFSGKLHRLTDFRRKRVLLITWASW